MVARRPHLDAIRANVLTIETPDRTIRARVAASNDPADLGPQDLATSYSEALAKAEGDKDDLEAALIEARVTVAALGLVPEVKEYLEAEARPRKQVAHEVPDRDQEPLGRAPRSLSPDP